MSKEAMRQALEALETERENYQDWDKQDGAPEYIYEAITALREALAEQPAQQQIASTITITQRGSTRTIDNHFEDCVRDWPDGEYKLYTTPPAQRTWVDLTFAEICECENDYLHIFARAIEAKLRSKNEDRN